MRVVGCLVVLTAIGCSAKSSSSGRGSSSSRSSSSSSRSSGGSYGSSYGSSSSSSRYTSSYVSRGTISRSAGLTNYNSFAAGAAVGYIVGSSRARSYYYGYSGYRYSGSYNFGESVCKSSVSQLDIDSDNDTLVQVNSTDELVVIYWACRDSEHCCELDCCPNSFLSITTCIIISIFVVVLVLACCCGTYNRYRKKREGLMFARQTTIVTYTNQVRTLQPSSQSNPNGFLYPQQPFIPPPQVAGSYPSANPFVPLPPPPPSTFHQQPPVAPFSSSQQQIPMSDPYQPAAFFPAPPNNPQGISTISSPLPPIVPEQAQLYPKPHIA